MAEADPVNVNGLADRDTPLIRDCWYFVALAEDVTRAPISRTVAETKIVLYRKENGEAVALHDRCLHRSYPLSRGKLEGDIIVCGYHGMAFHADGRCARLPAQDKAANGNLAVDRYPLVQRGPLLWIWVGDVEAANEDLIADYGWMEREGWVYGTGTLEIEANYVALHENLLDLTHFTYLHADTVGTPEYAKSPLEVHRNGDSVGVVRKLRGHEPPAAFGGLMGLTGKKVDRFSDSCFMSPGANVTHAWFEDPNPAVGAKDAFHMRIAHLVTPYTREKFRYQWFVGRDFAIENERATTALVNSIKQAFSEDLDALQSIDEVLDVDRMPFREYSFTTDKAGIAMRRTIQRMANEEAAKAPNAIQAVAS